MCRLPVAALLICSGLVELGQCDGGSLRDSMHELHGRFAVGLYRSLAQTENSTNLIVSPLSASASLGLLQLGARGDTLAQLEGTLGYNVNGERAAHTAEAQLEVLQGLLVPGGGQSGCRHRCYGTLQNAVVSGALIPASTPAVIVLTTPAARPRGREVALFNQPQNSGGQKKIIFFCFYKQFKSHRLVVFFVFFILKLCGNSLASAC